MAVNAVQLAAWIAAQAFDRNQHVEVPRQRLLLCSVVQRKANDRSIESCAFYQKLDRRRAGRVGQDSDAMPDPAQRTRKHR